MTYLYLDIGYQEAALYPLSRTNQFFALYHHNGSHFNMAKESSCYDPHALPSLI